LRSTSGTLVSQWRKNRGKPCVEQAIAGLAEVIAGSGRGRGLTDSIAEDAEEQSALRTDHLNRFAGDSDEPGAQQHSGSHHWLRRAGCAEASELTPHRQAAATTENKSSIRSQTVPAACCTPATLRALRSSAPSAIESVKEPGPSRE